MPDHDQFRLLVAHQLGDLGVIVAPRRRAVHGGERRGDRAGDVAHRDADALGAEVDPQRPHARRTIHAVVATSCAAAPAASSSAAGIPLTSLPPAVAMSPLPPPPPPTALAASCEQLRGVPAAAGFDGGDEADAAARGLADQHHQADAGMLAHGDGQLAQIAGVQAVDLGDDRTPSWASAASSARPIASCARSDLISSCSDLGSSSRRWTPASRVVDDEPTRRAASAISVRRAAAARRSQRR
jgi:hypothetical protein